MKTDDLIAELSQTVTPVGRYVLPLRVLGAGAAGLIACAFLFQAWLGLRPDLPQASMSAPFIFKSIYTVAVAAVAAAAAFAFLRPDGRGASRLGFLTIPLGAAVLFAALELVSSPVASWPSLLLGQSVPACLTRIGLLSLPILAALFWAARAFAPSDRRAAGGVIGLAAGALAAAIYSFHCTESAACFIAVWYTAAIALVGLTGMLIGPRLLRW
ncbi:MAG: DUF1109 domain-containing protein [Alphaproteobacteria bacterium]|nr:DUF1109 domain-containing protein [Alphaproteobacteria bacterium]